MDLKVYDPNSNKETDLWCDGISTHVIPRFSDEASTRSRFMIAVNIRLFSACKVTIYKQLTEYLISAKRIKMHLRTGNPDLVGYNVECPYFFYNAGYLSQLWIKIVPLTPPKDVAR
uniref:Uncharacterized protein n=1 Tax=Romanomermis culicivorax TaxID=13658 RepID=A0A915I8W6_ROMCU